MADIDLSKDPRSTWGASEEYKAAWHRKYGSVSPKAGATKADWVTFATRSGMDAETAESMTRDDLIAHYGADTVHVATASPGVAEVGAGVDKRDAGAGPSRA